MVLKLWLILLLVLMSSFVNAQEDLSPQTVTELTRRARAPELSLSAKGKISEAVAKYIQNYLSQTSILKNKTPKEFRDYFVNNPSALDNLGIKSTDPIRDVISEFSQLLNSIQVTEKLKKCSSNKKDMLQSIANKTGDDYSLCDQGKTVQEFVLWETPENKDNEKNSFPGFLYFDQARDLAAIKNISDISSLKITAKPSAQLGGSLAAIKLQNPGQDSIQVAKQLELRQNAYIRAVTNSFKTVAMLRVLYQNPGLDLKDINDLKDEVTVNCKECTEAQVNFMLKEVQSSVGREIQFNQKKHLSELEITKSICGKLSSRGYRPELKNEFFGGASDKEVVKTFVPGKGFVSDTIPKKVEPIDFKNLKFVKPDSSTVERSYIQQQNEKNAILATVGDGWEGLLLMTPELTSKAANNAPDRVHLDCLDVANPRNKDLISNAVAQARYAPIEYVKDLNKTIDFNKLNTKEVTKELKTLMNENKRSIGEAIMNQPELTTIVCNLANHIEHDEAVSEAKSMALTWGAMIVGGALELTGVLAPAGAWLQGAIITTEVVGATGIAADMYSKAGVLEDEAGKELISALAQGGDKELLESSFFKTESAAGTKMSANLLLAFSALNTLRFFKASKMEPNLSGEIAETADDVIVQNYQNVANTIELKELNQTVYKAIPTTAEESGSLASIEVKAGKKNAEKITRYIDALDPKDRMRVLNALEKNQVKTIERLAKIPCFKNKVTTKCLQNLQSVVRNSFNDMEISFKTLSQKIGKVDDDLAKTIQESHLSQMEVNQLAKSLPKEPLTKEAAQDLKEYMEYVSNLPLNKRMAAIKDARIIVKPGPATTPVIKDFQTLQAQAIKKEEKWFSKEMNALKKEGTVAEEDVEALAREKAKIKRADWQKRSAACSSKIPNSYTTAGIAKFVKLQKNAGPAYTAATYILSNLSADKDAFWFKKLGWEVVTSLIYSRIPGLILKNKMDTLTTKTVKETLVSMGVGFMDSRLYSMIIQDKASNAEFEKLMQDPKAKEALLEMAKKVSEVTESMAFKQILAQQSSAPDSLPANKNIDDEDSDQNMQDVFSDDKLREIYNQAIASQVKPDGMISTGNPANDLFAFNYGWTLGVGTPKRFFVQQGIKKMICMGDMKAGLALYTMDRLISGKLYYATRKEMIGQ